MDKKKLVRIILAAVGAIAVLVIAAVSVYMLWEEAPEVAAEPGVLAEKLPQAAAGVKAAPASEKPEQGQPFDTKRRDGVYTILLVGNDNGNGNTDTMMVAKLDTVRHSINCVSIPRDTLINVDWPIRKLNSVYWGAVNNGGSGIEALSAHVKRLLGFDVDCYAVLDLDAFVQAVDAIGGVYFDVPEPMFYEDYGQGLYLDLDAGYQLLDGYTSMCLCRYRSGYITGDLGRIEMQHKFLKAAAEQLIDLGNVPNIKELLSILSESMDTNLSDANIAWFIRQTLMCSSEDVNFYTAPNTTATVHGYSYAFLELYDWMDMVNSSLNPYTERVGEGDLDLVYMINGAVHCTGVLKGTRYFDMGGSTANAANVVEEATEEYTEEAQQTPAEEPPEPDIQAPEQTEPDNSGWDFLAGYQPPTADTQPSDQETGGDGGDDWLSFD